MILLWSFLNNGNWFHSSVRRNDSNKFISLTFITYHIKVKVREMILLLSFLNNRNWFQSSIVGIDFNPPYRGLTVIKSFPLLLECVILHNFHYMPHISFLNNGNWFQSSLPRIDSNEIISLTLQCVQIEVNSCF